LCSAAPAVAVQVPVASKVVSTSVLSGRRLFQPVCQPDPAIFGCAPAPAAGGESFVPPPAATKERKRPTVTSKESSENALTVAAVCGELRRLKVPAGTGAVSQQLRVVAQPAPAALRQLGHAKQAPSTQASAQAVRLHEVPTQRAAVRPSHAS